MIGTTARLAIRCILGRADVGERHRLWFRLHANELLKPLSDERYIRLRYRFELGRWPNLDDPELFTEKLQWLKLHDRNPLYTQLTDKHAVKQYVADRIGSDHVVPTIGIWDTPDQIDPASLPASFVLKTTHDSGGTYVCRDKNAIDWAQCQAFLSEKLAFDYFYHGREWPYKDVKRQIIAEPLIESLGSLSSVEYKLTCFDGKVKNVTLCTGIAHDTFDVRCNDNYDRDLNHLDWWAYYHNAPSEPPMPEQIHDMIRFAEALSAGIPTVRVDFYLVDGRVLFGEMTFYTWSGFIEFTPPEWDGVMGSWLSLPESHSQGTLDA